MIKPTKFIVIFAVCAMAVAVFKYITALPIAKISVKVSGETGAPMPGIPVNAGFVLPYNAWADSFKGYSLKAITVLDRPVGFDLIESDWVAPHAEKELPSCCHEKH